MLLCDFHIHTQFSDGKLSLKQVVDFYGQAGFDAIAITEHLCDENSVLGKTAHFLSKSISSQQFYDYIEQVLESGLPMIASSDLHRPEQMRSWKTLVNSEKSEVAILEAIKKQKLEFYFYNKGGHPCSFN